MILALASARYFSDTVAMMDWTEDALPRYAAMMRWSQTSFGDTVPIHSDVVDEGRHGPVNAALTPVRDALGVPDGGPSELHDDAFLRVQRLGCVRLGPVAHV